MKFRDLVTTQIRIFGAGRIPYRQFARKSALDSCKSLFKFDVLETPSPLTEEGAPKIIFYRSGEFSLGDKTAIINALAFEDRKITLSICGESGEGEVVFQELAKFLAGLDQDCKIDKEKPIILTHESSCIVRIDMDFREIFDRRFTDFLDTSLIATQSRAVDKVYPDALAFRIIYQQDQQLFSDQNITVSPKRFIFQPAPRVDPNEKEFLVCSPCDTKTHFKLIEALKKTYKAK